MYPLTALSELYSTTYPQSCLQQTLRKRREIKHRFLNTQSNRISIRLRYIFFEALEEVDRAQTNKFHPETYRGSTEEVVSKFNTFSFVNYSLV